MDEPMMTFDEPVAAPAPEPAVEVKKAEPQPAPAKKACCVVC